MHRQHQYDVNVKKLEKMWKKYFKNVSILIHTETVIVITHTDYHNVILNNSLTTPLSNYALYSTECSNGQYINLYEIMIPDIPGKLGELSTVEIYVKALGEEGLKINANHYHWNGAYLYDKNRKDRGALTIHHTAMNMHPYDFSKKTIASLEKTMDAIQQRLHKP